MTTLIHQHVARIERKQDLSSDVQALLPLEIQEMLRKALQDHEDSSRVHKSTLKGRTRRIALDPESASEQPGKRGPATVEPCPELLSMVAKCQASEALSGSRGIGALQRPDSSREAMDTHERRGEGLDCHIQNESGNRSSSMEQQRHLFSIREERQIFGKNIKCFLGRLCIKIYIPNDTAKGTEADLILVKVLLIPSSLLCARALNAAMIYNRRQGFGSLTNIQLICPRIRPSNDPILEILENDRLQQMKETLTTGGYRAEDLYKTDHSSQPHVTLLSVCYPVVFSMFTFPYLMSSSALSVPAFEADRQILAVMETMFTTRSSSISL